MTFTSYQQALDYLYENLPMFQRVGAVAFKKDLTNTLKLCDALDNPQTKFKSIHVAGTNGKGSTSHMLASILQSSGYKTGLYTSPHLKEFTERIRINGEEVSKQFVVDFVNRIQPVIDTIRPSFFEITVAMAFDYFAQQKVDVAVVEVGLGGRLDSTNVITPELSVITNIGWDHMDLLGDTLEKIAFEKAGIIKEHIPVVVSERQPEVEKVFYDQANTTASPLYFASDEFQVIHHDINHTLACDIVKNGEVIFGNLILPLQGIYQGKNLKGVLKVIDILTQQGWQITPQSLLHGLKHVTDQTGLKGRWQKFSDHPLIICDTGHNVDGIKEVVKQIQAQSYKKLFIIWGCVKDKDITEILQLLPKHAYFYFCKANIPRAMDATTLAQLARQQGVSGEVIPDVNAALQKAKANADNDDMIFIGGSTFVVAELEGIEG